MNKVRYVGDHIFINYFSDRVYEFPFTTNISIFDYVQFFVKEIFLLFFILNAPIMYIVVIIIYCKVFLPCVLENRNALRTLTLKPACKVILTVYRPLEAGYTILPE